MLGRGYYLIFVDYLDLTLIRILLANSAYPELPRLWGVAELHKGGGLSHGDHLQQLHVEAEEELDSLWRHSSCSDSKAMRNRMGQSQGLMDLGQDEFPCQ